MKEKLLKRYFNRTVIITSMFAILWIIEIFLLNRNGFQFLLSFIVTIFVLLGIMQCVLSYKIVKSNIETSKTEAVFARCLNRSRTQTSLSSTGVEKLVDYQFVKLDPETLKNSNPEIIFYIKKEKNKFKRGEIYAMLFFFGSTKKYSETTLQEYMLLDGGEAEKIIKPETNIEKQDKESS